MTPAARAALVAAAKPRAAAIVNCLAASSRRGLALHLAGLDPRTAGTGAGARRGRRPGQARGRVRRSR